MEESAVARVGGTLTQSDLAGLSRLLLEGAGALPERQAVQDVFPRSVRPSPPHAPSTLVTMNTRVLLENRGSNEPYEVTLSSPGQVDPALARVSVLSPLGASLLGLSVGDTVSWRAFGREHIARILGILPCGKHAWGELA